MDELPILVRAMREAGRLALSLQHTSHVIGTKTNQELVTHTDLVVNQVLKNHLMTNFPDNGWLSEESADDARRLSCQKIWIVDPVDGTKEYAANIPEYAISVALVEQGTPLLACVYNPASDEFFHAVKDGGAFCNGKRIHCVEAESDRDVLLLASRTEYERGEWDTTAKRYHVQPVGSIAYKLALVASGNAQATFSVGYKNEWDIAAGVLLVSEAGGIVTNARREKIEFNRENVQVDGIVATTKNCNDEIFELISQLKKPLR